jgi:hypothetical protein
VIIGMSSAARQRVSLDLLVRKDAGGRSRAFARSVAIAWGMPHHSHELAWLVTEVLGHAWRECQVPIRIVMRTLGGDDCAITVLGRSRRPVAVLSAPSHADGLLDAAGLTIVERQIGPTRMHQVTTRLGQGTVP